MNRKIERLRKIRVYLLNLVGNLSNEQLNEIPAGFNNNIIWNLNHLVAAQQRICYVRAGENIVIDDSYFSPYIPSTKPERHIDKDEVEIVKGLLVSTIDKLEIDYENKLFSNYTTFVTPYGVEVANIDDAIDFLLFHEGLHTGYVMAIKRLLK